MEYRISRRPGSRGRCDDCKGGQHCGSCWGCCSGNGDEDVRS